MVVFAGALRNANPNEPNRRQAKLRIASVPPTRPETTTRNALRHSPDGPALFDHASSGPPPQSILVVSLTKARQQPMVSSATTNCPVRASTVFVLMSEPHYRIFDWPYALTSATMPPLFCIVTARAEGSRGL